VLLADDEDGQGDGASREGKAGERGAVPADGGQGHLRTRWRR